VTPEEERNSAIIRRTLANYGRLPVDLWLQDYALDLVYEEPGNTGGGQDRATLREALARQFMAHPEITFVVREMLAAGGRVVVEGEVYWQEASGRRVLHQALIYVLQDGKVQRMRVYTQGRPV
jgi:ketosteroid isomerase-like protein